MAEFSRSVRYKDGHLPECKKCANARMRRWRTANPEKKSASAHRYYKNNSAKVTASAEAWRKSHPDQVRMAHNKWNKAWRMANPEKASAQHRWKTYHLTEENFRKMLLAQHYTCAICKGTNWGGAYNKPHVDHIHSTTPIRIRGLLCENCNQVLGRAHDNPFILRRAAEYLEGNLG